MSHRYKAPKKKASPPATMETENDYLELADSHEEAMRKHRAGDPAKALRFADRAIDAYIDGLIRFPRSFDMAYNKARLQLEMANEPAFAETLGVRRFLVLKDAILSHQSAQELNPKQADTIFNHAQVHTSLAEMIAEDDDGDYTEMGTNNVEALKHVKEALALLDTCFEIQMAEYSKNRGVMEEASMLLDVLSLQDHVQSDTATAPSPTADAQGPDQEMEWVSVEEAVTVSTLVDTVMAQVHTLTLHCSILNSCLSVASWSDYASPETFEEIQTRATALLYETLPDLLRLETQELAPRLSELMLARAVFTAKYLEVSLRKSVIDIEQYKVELDQVFTPPHPDVDTEEWVMAHAQALIAFNAALADLEPIDVTELYDSVLAAFRWRILIQAQSRLTALAALPNIDQHTLATTHLLRGDCALMLQVLAHPPVRHQPARNARDQLIKHAEVYYRNASKLYGSIGPSAAQEKEVCELKRAVVGILPLILEPLFTAYDAGNLDDLKIEVSVIARDEIIHIYNSAVDYKSKRWLLDQLEEMLSEGLMKQEVHTLLLGVFRIY